jgi:hypothetical protein
VFLESTICKMKHVVCELVKKLVLPVDASMEDC